MISSLSVVNWVVEALSDVLYAGRYLKHSADNLAHHAIQPIEDSSMLFVVDNLLQIT